MELGTIVGLLVAFGAIGLGNLLEGGHLGSVLQPTAAYIVLGGTLGAVVVQFPLDTLRRALQAALAAIRTEANTDLVELRRLLLALSLKARREGIIAIEREVAKLDDGPLRRSLELVVDGFQSKTLRSILTQELSHREEEEDSAVAVFEAAGGYSPTVGILGAVLGLIHVMENLSEPSKLGPGIAMAFVATLYGVAMANLVLLPISGRMRAKARQRGLFLELLIEGACSLADGEGPRLLEQRLNTYSPLRAISNAEGNKPPERQRQLAERRT